jgi:hypothetical protein
MEASKTGQTLVVEDEVHSLGHSRPSSKTASVAATAINNEKAGSSAKGGSEFNSGSGTTTGLNSPSRRSSNLMEDYFV